MSDKTKVILFTGLAGVLMSIPFMYFVSITNSEFSMLFAVLAGFATFIVYRDLNGGAKDEDMMKLLIIAGVSVIVALILSATIAASQYMDMIKAFTSIIEAIFKDPMDYLERTWIAIASAVGGAYYALNNQEKFYWTILKQ
jgi:alkylhydroperoxidase/carboxymuconolactone decarboxylase family protein YurZ